MKRGAELAPDHPLVVSWVRSPGKPNRIVKVNWYLNLHMSWGRLRTRTLNGPCSRPPLQMRSEGHRRLGPVKPKKEVFRTPEAAEEFCEAVEEDFRLTSRRF